MPLLRTTLFVAAALTTVYLCGFFLVLVGDPVDQVVQIVILTRSVTMTAWIVWAVFFAANMVLEGLKRQQLAEFADKIGIDEIGARRDRRNGRSAAR